jgi:hypothetical protein
LTLLLVFAVAASLTYAYWPREPNDDTAWDAPDTSYSPGPQGTKALYLLLQQLGLPVTRLRRPSYDQLPPGSTLWNLSGSPLGAVERHWLLDFVRGGGTFIGGLEPEAKLLAEAGLGEPEYRGHETGLASKEGLKVEAERFHSVAGLAAPERVYLTSVQGDPVAASWPVGKGHVVFLGLSEIARDDQIGKSDNGVFLTHLALAGGGDQVFDEFSTGFGDLGLASLLAKAPYRWGLLQAAVAFLVLLWSLGLRRAPAQPLSRIRRRQTADHVEAVARLWAEAGDAGLPLDSLLRAADDRARARLGMKGDERPKPGRLDPARAAGLGGIGGAEGEARAPHGPPNPFVTWVETVRPELGGIALELWGRATALAELRRPSLNRVREAAAALAKLEREAMAW